MARSKLTAARRRTVALVKRPFGMLRCAVDATLNRQRNPNDHEEPMSTPAGDAPGTIRKHRPYVPETMEMKELAFRAIFLGLILTVVLGAANAYLGLRAGITIAATYPAAVISMAVLRAWKGSLLEENIARTAGSIGEGIAAGPIFTIPAFVLC